jgi:hypothetical protein
MLFDRFIRYAFLAAVLFAVAVSFAKRAHASDYPVALEVSYQAVALADMAQTLDLRHMPGEWETNPILGSHPSDAKVMGYFALTGAFHALVAGALPPREARVWEYITIGLEVGCVARNYSLGVRFHVP